jgi:hypothetical protein
MTKRLRLAVVIVIPLALLTGCLNMPTKPSEITGSYTSGIKYENFDCSRLSVELDSLARRENQLVIAQEQRYKTSQMQAFWWGFGQGDGIEASELGNVRGEKEGVRKTMEAKGCLSAEKSITPIPITPNQGKVDLPTKPQPTMPPPSKNIVTVTWTFANIRSGAGNEFPIVTYVKQGDELTLLGERGEWLNVRLKNGQEGWISNRVVK